MRTLVAYAWVWFLLTGGVVDIHQLARVRGAMRVRKQRDTRSDLFHLRRATYLPAALRVGILWLLSVAALIFGAAILLQIVGQ